MQFKTVLNRLINDVPGALGAIIVDWEGEAVDQASHIDSYDIKVIGAHNGIILSGLRDALARHEGGVLEEVVIKTDRQQTLVAPLSDDYLLLLELNAAALTARASRAVRACVATLRDEFSI